MNDSDRKVRKQWLIILGLSLVFSTLTNLFYIKNPWLVMLPMAHYGFAAATFLFQLVISYVFYRCIYKKPGTKLLFLFLIFTIASVLITPILYLSGLIKPPSPAPYYGIYLTLNEGMGIWWSIVCWKMRKINKRLKALPTH